MVQTRKTKEILIAIREEISYGAIIVNVPIIPATLARKYMENQQIGRKKSTNLIWKVIILQQNWALS